MSWWGTNPFDSFGPQQQKSPTEEPFKDRRRKRKAIPEQRTLFDLQDALKKLGREINSLPDSEQKDRVTREYKRGWHKLTKYLREWAQ